MARHPSSAPVAHEHTLTGEKLSLLAIFAHPEDESFGPAGTLAKYASEGIQVSLVAATRTHAANEASNTLQQPTRDRVCSCRASGIRRACLFDQHRGELKRIALDVIVERLVRWIRETRPQVIITFGPHGLTNDEDNRIINMATQIAFHAAGDPNQFTHHLEDGLSAHAPQKLYYCLLPQSLVQRWGVQGINAVPDHEITTVLDVSMYHEAIKNALYCQRHGELDFIRWLTENPHVEWNAEYYVLIESRLRRKPKREKDLFAGLR
jgi:LmbE family N-acetylglucosaminyl deacetylase